jgi:hypothetical protein
MPQFVACTINMIVIIIVINGTSRCSINGSRVMLQIVATLTNIIYDCNMFIVQPRGQKYLIVSQPS